MKRFIYTHHARARLRQRGMLASQVELTITLPDRTHSSFGGRLVVQKVFGSKILEVVYRKLNGQRLVITAYWLDRGET